jgi:hypothetical protein
LARRPVEWQPTQSADPRRFAPSAPRNRDPIFEVLLPLLPERGTVLEVAAGSGQHAAYFASKLPSIDWVPSDRDAECLASIAAWAAIDRSVNLWPPIFLDTTQEMWPITRAHAVVNINMVHIAPFTACQGLMRGAARVLLEGGFLYMYGPYKIGGRHTSAGNEAFDEHLRQEDKTWGIRDVDEVAAEAAFRGLELESQVVMPANNLSLVFRKLS